MANYFGLSRAMSAVPNALDAVESRRDRASNRARNEELRSREDIEYGQSQDDRRRQLKLAEKTEKRGDTQYEQSQEDRAIRLSGEGTAWKEGRQDRSYTLGRRGIEDKRKDKEYKIAEKARDKHIAGVNALRAWRLNGDISAIESFANNHDAAGRKYNLRALNDGNYEIEITKDGKKQKLIKNEDEIGKYINYMMISDPVVHEQALASAAAEQAGKIGIERVKGEEARATEKVKQSGGEKATKQQNALVDDMKGSISKATGFDRDDPFAFEKPNAAAKHMTAVSIGEYLIRNRGSENSGQAGTDAMYMVNQWYDEIVQIGKSQGLEGQALESWTDSALYAKAKSVTGVEPERPTATAPAVQRETSKSGTIKRSNDLLPQGPSILRKKESVSLTREGEKPKAKKEEGGTPLNRRERAWARKVVKRFQSKKPETKTEKKQLKRAKEILSKK